MRTILTLLAMLFAQSVLATDVVTNYDLRSARALLTPGQHKTVGWMNKLGANFDGALNAKLTENGFTVGSIVSADFQFLITSAEVTLRRSGRVRSVKLSDLDSDTDFIVPAYKPRSDAIPDISRTRGQGSANPDAAAIGSAASTTGSAVGGYAIAAVVTLGVTTLIANIIEAREGSSEEGGEGLLQVHVKAVAEKGAKRSDIVVSIMPKTDQPVGVLFNAVAEAIVQVLMRGEEVASAKPAVAPTVGAGS